MDKDFLEKLESVAEWKMMDGKSNQTEYSLSFSQEEDGFVKVGSSKGNFTYKMKSLNELFSEENGKAVTINWQDEHYIHLLYTIERAIKRSCEENYSIADGDVITVLEPLAMKPEAVTKNIVSKAINQELRLKLSMTDYSRHEVKMAIRKILNSAKSHNKQSGRRGYITFILRYIP